MLPKLNKHDIRYISAFRDVKHTQECRTKKGNVKGDGGHAPSISKREDGSVKIDLGGYRCICDFMERIEANRDVLK